MGTWCRSVEYNTNGCEQVWLALNNLLVDPKEEVPELNYLNDTWVDVPLYRVVEEFEESLANDPGAPE